MNKLLNSIDLLNLFAIEILEALGNCSPSQKQIDGIEQQIKKELSQHHANSIPLKKFKGRSHMIDAHGK